MKIFISENINGKQLSKEEFIKLGKKIRIDFGRILDQEEEAELQKEIEANRIKGPEELFGRKSDIKFNLFNYNNPLASMNFHGLDLRIVEGLIRNNRKTFLLYADESIVGEFLSKELIKDLVKQIDQMIDSNN